MTSNLHRRCLIAAENRLVVGGASATHRANRVCIYIYMHLARLAPLQFLQGAYYHRLIVCTLYIMAARGAPLNNDEVRQSFKAMVIDPGLIIPNVVSRDEVNTLQHFLDEPKLLEMSAAVGPKMFHSSDAAIVKAWMTASDDAEFANFIDLHNQSGFKKMCQAGSTLSNWPLLFRLGNVETYQGLIHSLENSTKNFPGGPLGFPAWATIVNFYMLYMGKDYLLRWPEYTEYILESDLRDKRMTDMRAEMLIQRPPPPPRVPGGGAVNATSMTLNNTQKIIDGVPRVRVSISKRSTETEKLQHADNAIFEVALYFKLNGDSSFSDDNLTMGYIKAVQKGSLNSLAASLLSLVSREQSLVSFSAPDTLRKVLLEIRKTLSTLSVARIYQLDQIFMQSIQFQYGENLRTLLERVRFQHQIFQRIYDQTQIKHMYQGSDSFEVLAADAIRSLLPSADAKYQAWIVAKPKGTFAEMEAFAATESLGEIMPQSDAASGSTDDKPSRRKVGLSTDSEDDDDAMPVYAADGKSDSKKFGPIASEVHTLLKPFMEKMIETVNNTQKEMTAVQAKLSEQGESISNLVNEHDILRKGLTNRNENPIAFSSAAQSQVQAPLTSSTFVTRPPTPWNGISAVAETTRAGKLDMTAMVAAMQSTQRGPTTRANTSRPAITRTPMAERDDVNLDGVPKEWRNLVLKLLESNKKTLDDECVICTRGGVKPLFPHPTKKCGVLWTLTAAGLKWLQQRRDARDGNNADRKAATAYAEAYGYGDEELQQGLCAFCDDDIDNIIGPLANAGENQWTGEHLEAAVRACGGKA